MTQGVFVTFEGGEGAGKSTLINRLHAQLEKEGRQVAATREPGGTLLGDQIRDLLLSRDAGTPIGNLPELLLFLAARAQHIQEVIQPALEAGKIVLCDRFNDSTIAYQGAGRKIGIEKTKALIDLVCGTVQPHMTFFLDIDIKTGLSRASANGAVDRIESEKDGFHERVLNAFINIANHEPGRVHRIDATQNKEVVFEEVWQRLRRRMKDEGRRKKDEG